MQQIQENRRQGLLDFLARYGTLCLMILVSIYLSVALPSFTAPSNLFGILRQVAVIGVMACGLTFAVAAGGFDLSIGSVAALCTVTSAWLFVQGVSFPIALIAVLAVGFGTGWANGLFCARLGIVPWVGTLATMVAAVGPQFIMTAGSSQILGGLGEEHLIMDFLGKGSLGLFPVAALVMLLIAAFCEIVLSQTRLGEHILAVGGNPQAAETSGINVRRVLWIAYVFSGILAAAAGLLMAARMGFGQVRIGEPYLMDSIAAVFLGSTIVKEGQPHIIGTIIGTIFMGILFNGLTLLHVPFWGFYLFRGIMVFIAVAISGVTSR